MDYLLKGKIIRIKEDPAVVGGWLIIVQGSHKAYTRCPSYEEAMRKITTLYGVDEMTLEETRIEGPVEKLNRVIAEKAQDKLPMKMVSLPVEEAKKNLEEYLKQPYRDCLCGCKEEVAKRSLFRPGHDQRIIGLIKKYQTGKPIDFNPEVFKLVIACKLCGKTMIVNTSGMCHHCCVKSKERR